ncbi:hypothetical protein [Sporosarcina koreensis]|uniref:Tumour necrosis factor receptor superfamily member 19 n=1 Tax=Sporosarcina koreensis TaxID=334735 RepID=A0ABW0TUH7_9BACL
MWIIIFLLLIISLLFSISYSLSKIIDQLKLISEHFNVKEKEEVVISDEEIEKELEDESKEK